MRSVFSIVSLQSTQHANYTSVSSGQNINYTEKTTMVPSSEEAAASEYKLVLLEPVSEPASEPERK